jgi:hypothetical protein
MISTPEPAFCLLSPLAGPSSIVMAVLSASLDLPGNPRGGPYWPARLMTGIETAEHARSINYQVRLSIIRLSLSLSDYQLSGEHYQVSKRAPVEGGR